MAQQTDSPPKRAAVIGSYVPRQCGIATFSFDLRSELARQFPDTDFAVVAMTDCEQEYEYPAEVRWQIRQDRREDYRRVAEELNAAGVELVSLQHEFGIFGGEAGDYLLDLLRALRMPVVVTLHTVLKKPSPAQKRVLDEIIARASRVVVMSRRGAEILRDVNAAPEWKVAEIPHGVPELPDARAPRQERDLHLRGKKTLLTFGLVSPDKGIEHVIRALPAILERVPNAMYIVVGATHPNVKARQGETYRDSLVALAKKLKVDRHVIFHNRYVGLAELGVFLAHTDVYVTPYLKPEQITSGTLAYAMGSGRAIISTPYWYAEELLSEDRGVLVPFSEPAAIAEAAIGLLQDDVRRAAIQQRAKAFGVNMTWPLVAERYMREFGAVRAQPSLAVVYPADVKVRRRQLDIPQPSLIHLRAMTDSTGILQHAVHDVPNYAEGYCTDDNARALQLTTALRELKGQDRAGLKSLGDRYLAFLNHGFNRVSGRFRNFMSYNRTWLESDGSEDSHGRAVLSLAHVAGVAAETGAGELARGLFLEALPVTRGFTSPRAWAYTLLGICTYLGRLGDDPLILQEGNFHLSRLYGILRTNQSSDWNWFEDRLAYCNARLPQALLLGGWWLGHPHAVRAGLESLNWLAEVQSDADGLFEPVGSDRPYVRGTKKPLFDQQPVEVCASVSAYLDAARVSGESEWRTRATAAYRWFLGENRLGVPLADQAAGACFDGLQRAGINQNRGAESTISYLQATADILAERARSAYEGNTFAFMN